MNNNESVKMIDLQVEKAKLLGSLLYFTEVFYKLWTGKSFVLSKPIGCESHFITYCRAFTKVLNEDPEYQYLMINAFPGSAKSTLLKMFIAWSLAHYPFSRFLYVSYAMELATEHTNDIKEIVSLGTYERIFGVKLNRAIRAKDHFETNSGGVVKAFGSSGGITGFDGGLPHAKSFSGAILLDDIHNVAEVYGDAPRERVIRNYKTAILSRQRNPKVPVIVVGHRLDERDLYGRLIEGDDGNNWNVITIPGLDPLDNAVYPEVYPKEKLIKMREKNPDLFYPQFQQHPRSPGSSIFEKEWFITLLREPDIIATLITVDTAETDKDWNDATVFSFFGIYKIELQGADTGMYGLHWLECSHDHIQPKDLENRFLQFYSMCLRYKVPPTLAAIEKKSTGVTLLSVLEGFPGLQIVEIERTKASGSKTKRFLEMQPYAACHRITFPAYGRHVEACIKECCDLTKNDTHEHDDRADTLYDAIKIGLMDELIIKRIPNKIKTDKIIANMNQAYQKINQARSAAHGYR
jgi:predicted phage terminase large subunit-like protein